MRVEVGVEARIGVGLGLGFVQNCKIVVGVRVGVGGGVEQDGASTDGLVVRDGRPGLLSGLGVEG